MISLKSLVKVNPGPIAMSEKGLTQTLIDVLDSIREQLASPGPTTQSPEETTARKHEVGIIDYYLGDIEREMQKEGYKNSDEERNDQEFLEQEICRLIPNGFYFGGGGDYGQVRAGRWGFWPSIDVEDPDWQDDSW